MDVGIKNEGSKKSDNKKRYKTCENANPILL